MSSTAKRFFLAILLLALPAVGWAEAPRALSLDRFQAGLGVLGALNEDSLGVRSGAAEAQAWGSYSLASQASLSGQLNYSFVEDDSTDWTGRAGLRLTLPYEPDSDERLAFGVDRVFFMDRNDAWSASLRYSNRLMKDSRGRASAYLFGMGEYVIDYKEKNFWAGVRVPLIRGAE